MRLNPNNPIHAKAIREEKARREAAKAQASNSVLFDKTRHPLSPERLEFYLSKCHQKQRDFLLDPARFQALLCPRRTGKSTATLFKTLITGEEYPGCVIYYIVPDSKGHARRLFWVPLQKMNAQLGLGLEFFEADKRVVMPNGSQIYLFGAHDKDAAIQLRGDAVALAVLDECKDFGPHFEEVVVEAVIPALGEYQGTLVLAGTPGNVMAGRFYEMTKDDANPPEGWCVHHWIKSDNTFLPPEERDLKQVLKTTYLPFGLDEHSPKFRREQLAEWVTDSDERLYQYDNVRNHWTGELPLLHGQPQEWMYCLGLDLGERDANAFVVGAFSTTDRNLYIVAQYARPRMSIDEIAAKIGEYTAKYGNFVAMVADTGGYGRGIVTDLQDRHGIPLEPADKGKNKLGNISLMNSAFLAGRIKCDKATPLALEWLKLAKRIDPRTHKVLLEHTDLGDAALYMWKSALAWASIEPEASPEAQSVQWWKDLENSAINEAIEKRQSSDDSFLGIKALSDV